MKRNVIILASALAVFMACKNSNTSDTSATDENAKYKTLYEKSVKLKDYNTAIYAIQMILLTDSTNALRDSLPNLYGGANNLEACMQTNEEALKRHPNDERFKTIKLLCLQQTGDVEQMFPLLDELYKSTKKPEYIYQTASLHVATGNMKEAMKVLDVIMTEFRNNKTDSLDVMIDERNRQKVPVMAAAFNMKGYIYMQQKNIDKAKEAYFAALEIDPDYVMPKQNLEMIFARKY